MSSPEQDDLRSAMEEAEGALEETRDIPVTIPLGTAYDVGNVVVSEAVANRGVNEGSRELALKVLSKFEAVVPVELINDGREGYEGDLTMEVQVPLSPRDIAFIGGTMLSQPNGREMVRKLDAMFGWDPNDRAEFEGYRNQNLRSVLSLYDAFSAAGGRINTQTRSTLEEQLS